MTLREQYQKETGKSPHLLNINDGELLTSKYVQWLESQILIREEAAWDAAINMLCRTDEQLRCTYQSIEEWRKEQ